MTAYKFLADLEGEFVDENTIFRLLHFWESRKFTQGNILMGLELLLVDDKSTVVQDDNSNGTMAATVQSRTVSLFFPLLIQFHFDNNLS